jgi:membrane protein YdbS with pleckstrin-like domain
MYEPLRRRTLAFLKVPPEPRPPMGDPASLQVFRAGRNYFRLRIAGWAAAQVFALAGILFWTAMLIDVETVALSQKSARIDQPAATTLPPEPDRTNTPSGAPSTRSPGHENWQARFADNLKSIAASAERSGKRTKGRGRLKGWAAYKQMLVELALVLPASAFLWIWGLKIFSFVAYLLQIPITYAMRRLDYEMRWYMVTDRSLRLRHGVWKVSESTMSFANIQQVEVTQGPVQRLLGLANVKVQSAGGGGGGNEHQPGREDMHLGLFQSVTNAPAIRDLILERLRRYRESGLGDPDEKSTTSKASTTSEPADAIAAAQELLAEAKALRVALG